jgi:hypothetical protein
MPRATPKFDKYGIFRHLTPPKRWKDSATDSDSFWVPKKEKPIPTKMTRKTSGKKK